MSQRVDNIIIGINASRARSGGAFAHLAGILNELDPLHYGIHEVHVWSYPKLLNSLLDAPWLIKHSPPELEKSLFHQVIWEYRKLPVLLAEKHCSILLNLDAGSLCRYQPSVTMSRDMLSYEPGEIQRFGFSLARIRLLLLRYMQNASLKRADGVIFLTQYAANVIQSSCGVLKNVRIVPHGVADNFRQSPTNYLHASGGENKINLLYVSNTDLYKHQWHVVKAAEILYSKGYKIKLLLVGGGSGYAQEKLNSQISQSDPGGAFVECRSFVSHTELPELHAAADIFIFASSCENMPNTLIEAMAAGLAIACSDRGPMPEVLKDAGLFFDPETPLSIANAVENIIEDGELRSKLGLRAQELSCNYSWSKCADETWDFLSEISTLSSL